MIDQNWEDFYSGYGVEGLQKEIEEVKKERTKVSLSREKALLEREILWLAIEEKAELIKDYDLELRALWKILDSKEKDDG